MSTPHRCPLRGPPGSSLAAPRSPPRLPPNEPWPERGLRRRSASHQTCGAAAVAWGVAPVDLGGGGGAGTSGRLGFSRNGLLNDTQAG